jgi:hypothetical protein
MAYMSSRSRRSQGQRTTQLCAAQRDDRRVAAAIETAELVLDGLDLDLDVVDRRLTWLTGEIAALDRRLSRAQTSAHQARAPRPPAPRGVA